LTWAAGETSINKGASLHLDHAAAKAAGPLCLDRADARKPRWACPAKRKRGNIFGKAELSWNAWVRPYRDALRHGAGANLSPRVLRRWPTPTRRWYWRLKELAAR